MPTPEDIDNQQRLLVQHRANVATLLDQIAGHGGPIHAPLNLRNTLTQNRTEIARVKTILRAWGVEVADHPDDEASVAPAAVRPGQALHQLRAPVGDFVGRDEAVAKLVAALRTGPGGRAAAISGVRGMGGIGKTELAYAVAAQLQADYPDAQLLLELWGASDAPLSPAQALQQVIRAFRPEEKLPEDVPALQALYRSVLAGQRVLILADDARDAAQVRPLQPPVGCALLVTSRQRFLLDGMLPVDLDRLSEEAAVQLLRGICARLDETQAQQLAALCGYLPLALRISAGILATNPARPVARYLTQLTDERQRLLHMRSLDDPERDVAAVLRLSYAALDQPTQSAFRQLGVLAADADLTLIAAVLDEEGDQAETVLEHLLHRSLVEYDVARARWGLHDLVRVFALEQLAEAGGEHAARLRYAEQVIRIMEQPDWGRLDAVEREKRTAIDYYEKWLTVTRAINYRLGERKVLRRLGQVYANLGDARRAIDYYKQAVLIAQELGDRHGEGIALGNLGITYLDLGEARTAISYFQQAVLIAQASGDRREEGIALGNLGNAYLDLGEARMPISYFQQAVAIARVIGDRREEGQVLGNLGIAYEVMGEVSTAISYYEQAVAIARVIGDRRAEGQVLGNLGGAYWTLGEAHTAIGYYQQCLAIAREVGDRRAEGNALGNLGFAWQDLGNYPEAHGHYEQQLHIQREIGNRRGEAGALDNVGTTHYLLGKHAEALACCKASLKLAQEVGDRFLEGSVLRDLANVQAALGQPVEADANYATSLALLDELEDPGEGSRTRWAYGQFLVRQGERVRGIALMAECVAHEQHIGHAKADEHAALVEHLRAGGDLPVP